MQNLTNNSLEEELAKRVCQCVHVVVPQKHVEFEGGHAHTQTRCRKFPAGKHQFIPPPHTHPPTHKYA